MEKALVVSTVASTIAQFNMDNSKLLKEMGYEIQVVANFEHGSAIPQSNVNSFKNSLIQDGIKATHVALPRNILDIKGIWRGYREIKKICNVEKFDLIHCHSPIGSVVTRLAARKSRKKNGTHVMYTAHGFHFFKGAPLKNWLFYFPAEWVCSFMTDTLITINKEDFERAKKVLHAKKVEYIPGIGIDTEKIKNIKVNRKEKRAELGLKDEDIAVLSVGELNDNKNHETVLRAIARIEGEKLTYVICGKGQKEAYLAKLAKELGVKLILCGYRDDVIAICKACDIFAFPSKREGLSVALMEALGAGSPIVASAIRGNEDLLKNGEGGYLYAPTDVQGFSKGIQRLVDDPNLRKTMGQNNVERIKAFDIEIVSEKMQKIYTGERRCV